MNEGRFGERKHRLARHQGLIQKLSAEIQQVNCHAELKYSIYPILFSPSNHMILWLSRFYGYFMAIYWCGCNVYDIKCI